MCHRHHQELILSGNPLGDSGVVAVGHMLRSNASLRVLDISDTSAGVSGIISVSLLGFCRALCTRQGSAGVLEVG